jgi:hypothetical protein
MKYVIFAQAVACLVLVTSVLLLIWLSDHTEPKPPRGRHAGPRDHERLADTTDIPMSDVEWFRSLRQPRKPASFDLTRDVIPPPQYDPEYLPAPVWPTIFDPVVRDDIVYEPVPEPAPPLEPLPDERPVPAEPAAASECEAGTGPPAGELAPWVLDALRGSDEIVDSICARVAAS